MATKRTTIQIDPKLDVDFGVLAERLNVSKRELAEAALVLLLNKRGFDREVVEVALSRRFGKALQEVGSKINPPPVEPQS